MGFLLPLGFFFALSIPVLLLFYLLKVRRRPRRVSSTWLWRATVEDARASVPFQRLRRNLLMLLQILILALLATALARPILNLRIGNAGSVLILVDTSASMAMRAEPGGPTRLEEARERAVELVNSLPEGVQALVLPYASRALVSVPFTLDRARLRRAIEDLQPQATSQDLQSALVLAASLVGSEPSPQVVVFSDSARIGAPEREALGATPIVIESVGRTAPNFGWTALSVQRGASTADTYELFGQVVHHGEQEAEVTLRVQAEDKLLDVRQLRLVPGEETPVVVDNLSLSGEPMIRASLAVSDSGFDAMALDNEAWIAVRPSQKIRLLVCTPGNYFLSRALTAIEEVDSVFVEPGEAAPESPWDLAIYDRALPGNPPDAPALYIGLSPWDEPGTVASKEDALAGIPVGSITHWDSDHPVARNVQWSTINVFAANQLLPPGGTRALVESNDTPLLLVGRSQGQPVLHLAFDLFDSNFPLRAAFPIFVRNTVDWLTRDRAARETESWNGGETLAFALPEEVKAAKLVSPSNRVWELTPGPDRLVSFAETYETGVWRAEIPGSPDRRFGVNLMNRQESNPSVSDSMRIDSTGEEIATGLGKELRANREIWRWLAAAALLILLLEWILYRRPQTA